MGQERVDTGDLRGSFRFEIEFTVLLADRVVTVDGDLAKGVAAARDTVAEREIFGEVERG